jgi:thiamine pyrophosphate-dependent acetolactate synthase large subunit-like protein
VQFPDADLAAIARASGAQAATIRRTEDLDVVDAWLAEAESRPLVLDAKVNPTICAEWLSEAFRAG